MDVSAVNRKGTKEECVTDRDEKIILNPRFEHGVDNWSGRGCNIFVLPDSVTDKKLKPLPAGKFFAAATGRTQYWNGIGQDLTGRVQRYIAYEIIAIVRIYGNNVSSAEVLATLCEQESGLSEKYFRIAKVQATDKAWVQLRGTFNLNSSNSLTNVMIKIEGPPHGVDILVNSFVIKHAT